ncbi:hypothetical protein COCOBI_12-0860 [Coccomyxa sp. Obi]|nr:hypothetical protein COCOBI_12-0860 [Coccomyxa sp. Obi]
MRATLAIIVAIYERISILLNAAMWSSASNSHEVGSEDGSRGCTSDGRVGAGGEVSPAGQSGSRQSSQECGNGCNAVKAAGSLRSCDPEQSSTVLFTHMSSPDTIAFAEEGVTVGEGSLDFSGGQERPRLTWVQAASLTRNFGLSKHSIQLRVGLTFNCCFYRETTYITLEQLEGGLVGSVPGLTLDSILISIQATRGGEKVTLRMQGPNPLTCSQKSTTCSYRLSNGYWRQEQMDLSAEVAPLFGKHIFLEKNGKYTGVITSGTCCDLTHFKPALWSYGPMYGERFELRRDVEATLQCHEDLCNCSLPCPVLLLESDGVFDSKEIDLQIQVCAQWNIIPQAREMYSKIPDRIWCWPQYGICFKKKAQLKGKCRD